MTKLGLPSLPSSSGKLHICHISMGDLWAGAEVQLKVLLSKLVQMSEFDVSVILFNHGRMEKEIEGLGIPVTVFPELEWGSGRIFVELVRAFKKSRTQLIHTHKYKDTILTAPAARLCGVSRVVRTVHGLREPFAGLQAFKMNFYEVVERAVHRCCVDAVIGVSSHIESVCKGEGIVRKVVCIRNGIDLEEIPTQIDRGGTRKELGVDSETCLIGTVGRLTAVKGLPYLMQAARILLHQGVKVKVLVIGDGPMMQDLGQQAHHFGIGDNVVFLGHREDTHRLMGAVDIFALPSLSEGIPMALLEAMAASRAIIASRVGGVPEVVEHGVEGILVEPKDVNAFVEGCLHFIRNPDVAVRMGELARKRVERDFSAEGMAQQVASLYLQLAAAGQQVQH